MAREEINRDDQITAEDVRGRSESAQWLPTDRRRALAVARAIRHPLYRCQALAGVAQATQPHDEQAALLAEALLAAHEQVEPNRVACAASWPLRVMVASEYPQTGRVVRQLLDVVAEESHGLRRLDALAAILGPLLASAALRPRALALFIRASECSTGWRTERLVSWMAVALAPHDRVSAMHLLDRRSINRFATKARLEIASLK
jgi:hypothetical protein